MKIVHWRDAEQWNMGVQEILYLNIYRKYIYIHLLPCEKDTVSFLHSHAVRCQVTVVCRVLKQSQLVGCVMYPCVICDGNQAKKNQVMSFSDSPLES